MVTNDEVASCLQTLASNPDAGWVRIPGIGIVGLQGQSAKLLSRRSDSQEWTDEAARFWCAVCWAGGKEWFSDPRIFRVFNEI